MTKQEKQKFTKDEALAKIKSLISNYFENIGREMMEDTDITRRELIDDIDNILNDTDISSKQLIIERFKLDKLNNGGR